MSQGTTSFQGDISLELKKCMLYVKNFVNGKEKFVSVGIVSYGIGCVLVGYPGLFFYLFSFKNILFFDFFN